MMNIIPSPACTCWSDDVLMEILLWLPAKSLIRLKLVSKHWLSLISSHHFSHLHTLRHPKSQSALLLSTSSSQQYFFYFYPSRKLIPHHFPAFTEHSKKILSSCSGLVLLQCDVQKDNYFIYNPTTRESRKLPISLCSDTNDGKTDLLSLNLAFDPSISPYYKIICVKETSQISVFQRCCQIEVYNSETHTWKVCLESFIVSTHVFFPYSVHLKNVIYWGNCPHASLYYDIGENKIGGLPDFRIPWPPPMGRVRGGAVYAKVQESNGRLYRPVKISGIEKSIAVFELDENRSEWLLKYHDVVGRILDRVEILCFVEEEDEGNGVLLFQLHDKITGYRFLDKSYGEIVDFKNEVSQPKENARRVWDGAFGYSGVHHFCLSLAPV